MFPFPQTSLVGPLFGDLTSLGWFPRRRTPIVSLPRVPIGRRTGRTDLACVGCYATACQCGRLGLVAKHLPGAAASVTSFHAPCSMVVRGRRTLISGRSSSQGAGLNRIEASFGSGSGGGNRLVRLTASGLILSTLGGNWRKLGLEMSVLWRIDARNGGAGGNGGQVRESCLQVYSGWTAHYY